MNKFPRKSRREGFTLLELIMTAGLSAFVGITLYSAFANGINIWQKILQDMDAEDVNIFLEKTARDLRGSFQFQGIAFRGTSDQMSFPVLIQSRGRDGVKEQIGEAVYTFYPKKGEVIRRYRNYSELYEEKAGREDKVIGRLRALEFQYYYYDLEQKNYAWTSSWQAEEQTLGVEEKDILPVAVRIRVGIQGGNGPEEFVKTVSIPAGCCAVEDSEDDQPTAQ